MKVKKLERPRIVREKEKEEKKPASPAETELTFGVESEFE